MSIKVKPSLANVKGFSDDDRRVFIAGSLASLCDRANHHATAAGVTRVPLDGDGAKPAGDRAKPAGHGVTSDAHAVIVPLHAVTVQRRSVPARRCARDAGLCAVPVRLCAISVQLRAIPAGEHGVNGAGAPFPPSGAPSTSASTETPVVIAASAATITA